MLTLRLITSLLYDHNDKEQEIRLETEFARARQQFNDSLIQSVARWHLQGEFTCYHRKNTRELSLRSKHNLYAAILICLNFSCLFLLLVLCLFWVLFVLIFVLCIPQYVRCYDVTVTSLAVAKNWAFVRSFKMSRRKQSNPKPLKSRCFKFLHVVC